ncbi:hypothetical protein KJ693_05200 [bacterium]|nr:hypothetical protein [bacterium]MBU1614695.1 hypothetical protein [bacterium]
MVGNLAVKVEHPGVEVASRMPSATASKNIFLSNIGVNGYHLRNFIPINIEYEEIFVAISYDINMFGYGDTEQEAIRDLCESIVEYYEDLKESKDELGPIPASDYDFLKDVIIEVKDAAKEERA